MELMLVTSAWEETPRDIKLPKVFGLFRGRSSQHGTLIPEHSDVSIVNYCNIIAPSLQEQNTNVKAAGKTKRLGALASNSQRWGETQRQ